MSKITIILSIFTLSIFYNRLLKAEQMEIIMPILEDAKHHEFFFDLLDKALKQDHQSFRIIPKKLPQLRVKHYLDIGKISIYWLLESKERNMKFEPIHVNLTNGLIGKRVLLIKPGRQKFFNIIKSLDDFRNLKLVGGFGKKWFDVKVWDENNLLYLVKSGNYKILFEMLDEGKFDYFSRGINEVFGDLKEHPYLEIEKNLVLIYNRDFKFYLSKKGEHAGLKYKQHIKKALVKARESGLIKKIVNKHWGKNLIKLNYKKRTKLILKTPK